MRIGSVNTDEKVFVVAEIGNNHEGKYVLAERMIGIAAEAGVGAVKFQTIVPERLVAPREKERLRQLQKFQLSYDQYEKLARVAEREGVSFLSTPFDMESAKFLNALVPAFKIASGDNNFWSLIEVVARTGKPIIVSSGLSNLGQIRETRDYIQSIWEKKGVVQELAVLHCVSNYPTLPQEANLLAIQHLRRQLGVTVGYSDHTVGIDAAVLSIALGARIIEKHFTLDKQYSEFRDHELSADPNEMAEIVKQIGKVSVLLGDGEKRLQNGEKENLGKMRRSIVASRDLTQGTILQRDGLTWLRPGGGLAPGCEEELLGKRLNRSIPEGDYILHGDVEDI